MNQQEWCEEIYKEVLRVMGKPISITPTNRFLYNCPVCHRPKFYLYPTVGYCHKCGKIYLMKELKDILDLSLSNEHLPRKAVKAFWGDDIKTYIDKNKKTYIQDKYLIHLVYYHLYTNLPFINLYSNISESNKTTETTEIVKNIKAHHWNTESISFFKPINGSKFKLISELILNKEYIPGVKINIYNADSFTNLKQFKIDYENNNFKPINTLEEFNNSKWIRYEVSLTVPKSYIFFYHDIEGSLTSYNARIINPKEDEPKYKWATGSKKHLYIPADSNPMDFMNNFIAITEGEKKAIALTYIGIDTVGVAGVNCFRVPELDKFNGNGREVMVLYDDPENNPNVLKAEKRLCKYLKDRNFFPIPIHIPDKVDDYLYKVGIDAFKEFLAKNKAEYLSRRRSQIGMG